MDDQYHAGFGNFFSSESLPETLPTRGNTPQKVARGLIAEQLNGSAFTMKRKDNFRTWFYRMGPSVVGSPFRYLAHKYQSGAFLENKPLAPEPLRWSPLAFAEDQEDFVDSLFPMVKGGSVDSMAGLQVHIYRSTASMERKVFCNADGDLLIVPQQGKIQIDTEFGPMGLEPGEIAVIQRGMLFRVCHKEPKAYGYVCENFGEHFELPNLGPIGANGLANPQDFLVPKARFEQIDGPFSFIKKFQGHFWESELESSPFNVVAWRGNYTPYKYDLRKFNVINSVSFDHLDPSIFTVLTSPTTREGLANIDFVIFPSRWLVAEDTFRPPYFHRNIMSEYMGLIHGAYDAKGEEGFAPGGSSLHNCMVPHGPDREAYLKGINEELKPSYLGKTLAFMFESSKTMIPAEIALTNASLQQNYRSCWRDIPVGFSHP